MYVTQRVLIINPDIKSHSIILMVIEQVCLNNSRGQSGRPLVCCINSKCIQKDEGEETSFVTHQELYLDKKNERAQLGWQLVYYGEGERAILVIPVLSLPLIAGHNKSCIYEDTNVTKEHDEMRNNQPKHMSTDAFQQSHKNNNLYASGELHDIIMNIQIQIYKQ